MGFLTTMTKLVLLIEERINNENKSFLFDASKHFNQNLLVTFKLRDRNLNSEKYGGNCIQTFLNYNIKKFRLV